MRQKILGNIKFVFSWISTRVYLLRRIRFRRSVIVVFLFSLGISWILCNTYFYLDLSSSLPDHRDIKEENINYHSFDRLNFGKVKNTLDLIPLLDMVMPNHLDESRLCLESRIIFDIDISGLGEADKRKFTNSEISMIVQQGPVSKTIKSMNGKISCISVMNNVSGNIEIGSVDYPALYSTSTVTGLVSRKLADITKSKIYIWPGVRNLMSLTIIIFLSIPIIFVVVKDIWNFYVRLNK